MKCNRCQIEADKGFRQGYCSKCYAYMLYHNLLETEKKIKEEDKNSNCIICDKSFLEVKYHGKNKCIKCWKKEAYWLKNNSSCKIKFDKKVKIKVKKVKKINKRKNKINKEELITFVNKIIRNNYNIDLMDIGKIMDYYERYYGLGKFLDLKGNFGKQIEKMWKSILEIKYIKEKVKNENLYIKKVIKN